MLGMFPTGSNAIDGLIDEVGAGGVPSIEVVTVPQYSFSVTVAAKVRVVPTVPTEETER